MSTYHGVTGAGQIPGSGGTDGSEYSTDTFDANVGDQLKFFFNFVTADGTSSFPDYAWASFSTSAGNLVGYLFTARTTTSGNTSPGFGLPANISTLDPATTPITPTPPIWSPLGTSSGACYQGPGQGCGYTGWIGSNFTIDTAGSYYLTFGATNFGDEAVDTGLAFDGATIAGNPIGGGGGISPVPLPASLPMFGGALLALGIIAYGSKRRATGGETA